MYCWFDITKIKQNDNRFNELLVFVINEVLKPYQDV